MPTARLQMTLDVGGLSIRRTATQTEEGQVATQTTLTAAQGGTLSTRTDNDTGTLTLDEGHNITTGAIVDIYWDGGRRYGVTVGTVAGSSVPFGAGGGEGSGDNLPAQDTAITVQTQVVLAIAFEGDDVAAMAASFTKGHRGHIGLFDAGGIELSVDIAEDGTPFIWADDMPYANPVAADSIIQAKVTHADATETCEFQMGVCYNAI